MPAINPDAGPVAVTGASGYVGGHTVLALLERGYEVRACLTDTANPDKTGFLNDAGGRLPGSLSLHQANLLDEGSYDEAFAGCTAVLHVGTAMGYGGANSPQQVYDAAINGTRNVLGSIDRARTVQRLVYTSSFAAISHPAPPGYVFTENDWASDNREEDVNWNTDNLNDKGETGYAMAKVECEHIVNRAAAASGRYDAISVCPIVVLGPLLSSAHELVYSWQWALGRMLAGKECRRGWQHLWNVVDVRDVAAAHALILGNEVCGNGSRYQLAATDARGELSVRELQTHLQALFPDIEVGGPPAAYDAMIEKHGKPYDAPRAYCTRAREELTLATHPIEDTLRTTGETMIELGLVEPARKQ